MTVSALWVPWVALQCVIVVFPDHSYLLMDIMRQSSCLVVNRIMVNSCGFLFNCTAITHASDPMTTLTLIGRYGARFMSAAGPTVAQFKIF